MTDIFYDELKNKIYKRCISIGDYDDAGIGGESFETIINETSNKLNHKTEWKKFSKNTEGFDQIIKDEKMSIKTVKQNKKTNQIRLTSYRLTECKESKDFLLEIEKRDKSYTKIFLMLKECYTDKCKFTFFEIPVYFFKLSNEFKYRETRKSMYCNLENNKGTAKISFSASNQLSFNIKKEYMIEFKTYQFIMFKNLILELKEEIDLLIIKKLKKRNV